MGLVAPHWEGWMYTDMGPARLWEELRAVEKGAGL